MYNNTGKQIKNLVATIASIEVIACVIIGIVVACIDFDDMWWIGLIIIVGGLLITWISYLFMYAYGELVDKTCLIENYLTQNNGSSSVVNQNKVANSKAETTPAVKQERVAGPNEWKCSKCGTINQNYVGTCGCGQTKAEN